MEARAIEVVADSEAATLPVSRPRFRRFLPVARFSRDRGPCRGHNQDPWSSDRGSASLVLNHPQRRTASSFLRGFSDLPPLTSVDRSPEIFSDDATREG